MNLLLTSMIATWLNTTFANFDMNVFEIFGSIQSKFLTVVAELFSAMGATFYVALFAVFGLVLCLFRRSRKIGMALVFSIIIGTVLTNVILKPLVLRIRPYNALQNVSSYINYYIGAGMLAESDYSFPSGHSTGAMEIAMVLLFGHAASRKGRKFCWIFPIIGLLTCASRIYLMVHYATDVIAGALIGIIAGISGYLISRAICRVIDRHRAEKDAESEKPKKNRYIPRALVGVTFAFAWGIMFIVAYIPQYKLAHTDVERCAYEGDYICMNEAETGDKYPAIDGKYYCKIHWKEISKNPDAVNGSEQSTDETTQAADQTTQAADQTTQTTEQTTPAADQTTQAVEQNEQVTEAQAEETTTAAN